MAKRTATDFAFLFFIIFGTALPASSKDLFEIHDIDFDGKLLKYHAEDINHDGLNDLLLVVDRSQDQNPVDLRFSVYLQNSNGFPKSPLQTFKIPDGMILFDLGNVNGDERKELVFFKRSGVFYYEFHQTGFELTPKKLFANESIFMLPGNAAIDNWDFVTDLNGDGSDEIFIPDVIQSAIFFKDFSKNVWIRREIKLRMEAKSYGFYSPRFSVGSRATASYATPYLLLEDFNADSRRDLLAVYQDSLLVFEQQANGFFSQNWQYKIDLHFGEIWRGKKIQRTHLGDKSERSFLIRIKDLNHDGILDVVGLHVSTTESILNPENDLRIYLGKKRASDSTKKVYFAKEPDQVLKTDGNQLVLDILDLNNDGKSDLVMPVVKVGLRNIIRMMLTKTVEIEAQTYLMDAQDRYPEKPDVENKLVVKFTYRGGANSPVYEIADFNGDGQVDILSSLEEKMLIVFWGEANNIFASSVGAKFNIHLPQDGEMVQALEMNGDPKCDLIILYGEGYARKELRNRLRVLLAN